MNFSSTESLEDKEYIAEYLSQIPSNSPAELFKEISKFGYIGQDNAKKAVSLLAFRHVNRLEKFSWMASTNDCCQLKKITYSSVRQVVEKPF